MAYDLVTKNGHNMYDMASMMQKAIRRNNPNLAGYAAYELFGNFHTYMWKRLVVVSAEDCYGIMTKEVIALKLADDFCNKGRKGYDKDPLFAAKAITLLCQARKNRDACYVACNFMLPDRILDESEIEHIDITKCHLGVEGIPDWVFDVHTLTGKRKGKTDLDMTIEEQAALEPKQMSLFDDCSWENYYTWARSRGKVGNKEWADFQQFKKGRKLEPDYNA